jgi:hypothetical protein
MEEQARQTPISSPSHSVVPSRKGIWATLLGQFASPEFWRDLISLIVREAFTSFISVLGGSLIHAVQKRTTDESTSIRRIVSGGTGPMMQPVSSPSSAFSGGYQPQPQYKPTYAAPVAQNNSSQPLYPGFGS